MNAKKQQEFDAKSGELKKIWDKLFSILKSAKTGTTSDCHRLSELPANERVAFVTTVWGGTSLTKIQPILTMIESLENSLSQLEQE